MRIPALGLGVLLCLHSPATAGGAPRLFAPVTPAWGVSLQMFFHSAAAAPLAGDALIGALKRVKVKDPSSLAALAPLVSRLDIHMKAEQFERLSDDEKLAAVLQALPNAKNEVLFKAINLRDQVRSAKTSLSSLDEAVSGLSELRDLYAPYLHGDADSLKMIEKYHALGSQRLAESNWKATEEGFRRVSDGADLGRTRSGPSDAVPSLKPAENEPSAKALADFDAAARALKLGGRHDHRSLALVERLEKLALANPALEGGVVKALVGALGSHRPAHDLAVLESIQRIVMRTGKLRVKQLAIVGVTSKAVDSRERRFAVGVLQMLERVRFSTPDMQVKELIRRQFVVYQQSGRYGLNDSERRIEVFPDSLSGLPPRRRVLTPIYLPVTAQTLAKRVADGGSLHDGQSQRHLYLSYPEVAMQAELFGGSAPAFRTAAQPGSLALRLASVKESLSRARAWLARSKLWLAAAGWGGASALMLWSWRPVISDFIAALVIIELLLVLRAMNGGRPPDPKRP